MRSMVAAALALACLAPLAAVAQNAPPPPPPPAEALPPPPPPPPAAPPAAEVAPAAPAAAPAPATSAPTLNWEAQVDAYYMYNFTGDPSNQGPNARVFDNNANSFTLNMAKLATYMTADPVGFRIDVIYGNVGLVSNGLGAATSAMTKDENRKDVPSALYTGAFFIEQAFATVKAGIFTLDVGRFVTNASDEVIETKANWNYSRSLLFLAQPAFHTGARLGIAVNEMLSLQLGVVNGWNNDPDNNTNKTFGGQVALTLPSKTTAFFNTYIGKEVATGTTPDDVQMIFDLVVGQTINDNLALSLNADYFKVGETNWWGVGLKAKVGVTENFYLAPRVEYIKSKKGAYGTDAGIKMNPLSTVDAALYEFTLTGAFPIKKNYEIRAELRGDFSDQNGAFAKGTEAKKNQFTGLVGFLAWLP